MSNKDNKNIRLVIMGRRLLLLFILLLANKITIAENLLDIYKLAVKNDPTFLAARQNYLARKQTLVQARGTLFPSIDATAAKSRIDSETITDAGILSRPSGKSEYDSASYTLTITQPIYNSALFSGLRQARAVVRQAEAEFSGTQQSLITRVATAYFGVLLATDNLELALAEQTAIARQLEVAKGRLEVGLATITDVHDARARFKLAEAQVIESKNNLQDARFALQEITGALPKSLNPLSEAMPLVKPQPDNIESWVKTALKQNLQLQAKREAVTIAKQAFKLKRAGHIPTLNLVGTRTRTDADGSISGPGIRSDSTTISLELNIPIFKGGITHSESKQAYHQFQAARQDLIVTIRSTERKTRSSFSGVSSGASRVLALKQAVVASESALRAKEEGFQAGINTNLDVLDAQRDLYRAKRDYSDARYTYIINQLQLREAAGILSPENLSQVNNWLE